MVGYMVLYAPLDSRSILFEDPELEETLALFATLIGCVFFTNPLLNESE